MFEIIIYILTLLASLTVVGSASSAGALNGAFSRSFAGVATQIVSTKWLISYTNTESFLRACLDGQLGIIGYIFLASLGALILTWTANIYNYRQAII
jgi:hypothetical protein